MQGQPEIIQQALAYAEQGREFTTGWLLSPAASPQLGLLIPTNVIGIALKDNGIEIACPHRVSELKGGGLPIAGTVPARPAKADPKA